MAMVMRLVTQTRFMPLPFNFSRPRPIKLKTGLALLLVLYGMLPRRAGFTTIIQCITSSAQQAWVLSLIIWGVRGELFVAGANSK